MPLFEGSRVSSLKRPLLEFVIPSMLACFVFGAESSAESKHYENMIHIKGGVYRPLFRAEKEKKRTIRLKPFWIDKMPVTQADFRNFVEKTPIWRRSARRQIFADENYLRHWKDDLTPNGSPLAPVTEVSWFAAKTYCASLGKRLPKAAEWEFVALASAEKPDARKDPKHTAMLLEWYSLPTPKQGNLDVGRWKNWWGIYDIHGLIWEWVGDFNSELTTGESREDSDIEKNLFCGAGALQASEKSRSDYAAFMRYAFRGSLRGTYAIYNLGFRCASDVKKDDGDK